MAADVTVMGGGILGLATAWACARRGARLRVIERAEIGAGASGGVLGALAPHVPEGWNPKKAFQFESLIMAADFWAEVERLSGLGTGFARLGRLMPLADATAAAQAERRAAAAAHLWQGQAAWRVEAGADDGWRGTSPTGLWVRDDLSARLAPRRALRALAGAVRALGGEVIEQGRPAAGGGPGEPPAGIFGGRKWPGPVIWATGVQGLAELSADLGRPVGGGVKGQAALLACAARDRPQLFVGGLHIVPHGDGTVAVGSTSERDWADPRSVDDRLEELIGRARAACPALRAAQVIERWAGVRPRAGSRAPMLGPWPGRAGHFVANGGFKIGFGMAPKVAEVMADLVLEGRDRIPAGLRVEDSL